MSTPHSTIDPAPSLDQVLSHRDARIGQVDFTTRLAPEPEPQAADEAAEAAEAEAAATDGAATEQALLQGGEPAESGERAAGEGPLVMPQADLAAEAARIAEQRAAEKAAREAEQAEQAAREAAEAEARAAEDAVQAEADREAAAQAEAREEARRRAAEQAPTEPATAEQPEPSYAEAPTIFEPGTDLAALAASLRAREAARAGVDEAADASEQDLAEPLPGDGAGLDEQAAQALLSLVTESEGSAEVALTVDEVVDRVLTRIREAEAATQRHLAAIEAEAARRCELVTAQAELDSELIRLHARREAHAIITAARSRAGGGTGDAADEHRLHEVGEALSRFAEEFESFGGDPGTPDRPQMP